MIQAILLYSFVDAGSRLLVCVALFDLASHAGRLCLSV